MKRILFLLSFLLILSSLYALDFNVSYLHNQLDENNISIDTNFSVFRIDVYSTQEFDLNYLTIDINAEHYFTDFYLFKDTNSNLIFDSNDEYLNKDINFSDFNTLSNSYDLNINIDEHIDTNLSYFIVLNLNTGITEDIQLEITDINSSIDRNINYLNNIDNYLITPELIVQTGNLESGLLDLDYYSFSDVNNTVAISSNLLDILDTNNFTLLFNGIDYREKEYKVKTDTYNSNDCKTLYFDLNQSIIRLATDLNKSLDINISYFNIIGDYYFLVYDTNVQIYRFSLEDTDLNYLSTIDTNDEIYSLEKWNDTDNDKNYLFLANNGNGISVYDVSDTNINDANSHNVGNVVYNSSTHDYNITYISSLYTPNGLSYIVAHVNDPSTDNKILFYKMSDLVDLNSTVNDNLAKTVDGNKASRFWIDSDYNSIYIPYENEEKATKIYYSYSDILTLGSDSDKSKGFLDLGNINNRVFALTSDYNGIASYDLHDLRYIFENTFSAKSTINIGEHIYSMSVNKDTNQIFAQLKDKIVILDYNFSSDLFSIDRNINNINTYTNELFQSMIIRNNTLNIGQTENFSQQIIDQNLNYSLKYYKPQTTIPSFSSTHTNITKSIYDSFDGDITLSFSIYDYNTEKNNTDFIPYTFNTYLKNSNNTYNIETGQDIDSNICTLDTNRKQNCNYTFNIKSIHNSQSIEYNTYNLFLDLLDTNSSLSIGFSFDLTNNSGGGSNNSNNNNSNNGSTSGTTYPSNTSKTKQDYLDNILLLEQSYLLKQKTFSNYLLELQNINFNIDSNLDLDKIIEEYNKILEEYNQLPDLNIGKVIIAKEEIDNNFVLDYNYQKIDKNIQKTIQEIKVIDGNIQKKYYFIKIDLLSNLETKEIIIDLINLNKIKNSTTKLNQFKDNKYIFFNKDINYLVSQVEYSLSNLETLPIILTKIKEVQEVIPLKEDPKEYIEPEKHKTKSNFLLTLIPIIVILLIVYFVLREKGKSKSSKQVSLSYNHKPHNKPHHKAKSNLIKHKPKKKK